MKHLGPVIIIIVLGFFTSFCSGNFLEEKIREINSGTYRLSGIQVEETYAFPWFGDEILSSDTTEIEFTVEIKYPSSKEDTVRFTGLVGANSGNYQAVYRNCSDPDCFADAKLSGTELSFYLSSWSGRYVGKGYLGAETLILDTHFKYRSVGVVYDLQGEKIE